MNKLLAAPPETQIKHARVHIRLLVVTPSVMHPSVCPFLLCQAHCSSCRRVQADDRLLTELQEQLKDPCFATVLVWDHAALTNVHFPRVVVNVELSTAFLKIVYYLFQNPAMTTSSCHPIRVYKKLWQTT